MKFVSFRFFSRIIFLSLTGVFSCISTPVLAKTLSLGLAHACTIDAGGGVQCWGSNSAGQLGDGTFESRVDPVRVKGLDSNVVAVAATSAGNACALRSDGEVLCWGDNEFGQLGDGTKMARSVPTRVIGLGPDSGITAIAVGGYHACALRGEDGVMFCWGDNENGQIGVGWARGTLPVTPVSGLKGVTSMAAGEFHTCAIKSDQSVYCWGHNGTGALGDGTTIDRDLPTPVTSFALGSEGRISAGSGYTCVIGRNPAVLLTTFTWCWGSNWGGQLGIFSMSHQVLVPTVSDYTGFGLGVSQISGLAGHSCACTKEGEVFCSGRNDFGQLGDQTHLSRFWPIPAHGPWAMWTDVTEVAVGYYQSCAKKIGGTVLCWGLDANGREFLEPHKINISDFIFRSGFE